MPTNVLSVKSESVMLLLPCLRGRAGAWIVKRAASTCYRPGVRPFDQTRRGARSRRPYKTSHKPRNARLDYPIITDRGHPDLRPILRDISCGKERKPAARNVVEAGGYGSLLSQGRQK